MGAARCSLLGHNHTPFSSHQGRHTDFRFVRRPISADGEGSTLGLAPAKALKLNVLWDLSRPIRSLGTFLASTIRVVFSVISLFPNQKQRAQTVEIIRSVQDLARARIGCLGCSLSDEDVLHNQVRYTEQWESEEALKEHIRSDLYRRVLAAMELSSRPPEVNFYYTAGEKGFELIETSRGHAKTPASSPGRH